jgi:hypothetical protein
MHNTMKDNRGGKRKNSGRKPIDAKLKKKQLSIYIEQGKIDDIGGEEKTKEVILKNLLLSKWEHVSVSSKTASEILKLSEKTLSKYIKQGLIECDPRGENQNYRFSLGYILSLSRPELKLKSRRLDLTLK